MADAGQIRCVAKKGIDQDETRNRRVQCSVKLRKEKKDATLLKKRATGAQGVQLQSEEAVAEAELVSLDRLPEYCSRTYIRVMPLHLASSTYDKS